MHAFLQPNPLAGFISPRGLARWVLILLVAGGALRVVAILSTMSQIGLLMRVQQEVPLADGEADANDARQQAIAIGQVTVYIATVVLFLCWIRRAYRNLPALSRWKTRFAPGWAVGSWFVPLLNLVRPYQIVKETWWVSSSPSEADGSAPDFTPTGPALIKWWWAVYLISGSFGQMVFRKSLSAKTVPELLDLSFVSAIVDLMGIPEALLAFFVVHVISKRQDAAAQQASLVPLAEV